MITGTIDTTTNADVSRLVVVSNRLPIVLSRDNGEWVVKPGAGGLVTALAPVLRNRGGTWIGWPGTPETESVSDALAEAATDTGYTLEPVPLSNDLIDGYYHGFSNEVIWPLFHDFPARANYQPSYWTAYQDANRSFATCIAQSTSPRDYVWVHDYHLMGVAAQLRSIDVRRRTGFFLHIPFPSVDLFMRLPWRFQILSALLEFDMLGFQTARDTRNFIHCVRTVIDGVKVSGRNASFTVDLPDRRTSVGTFPIGIDARYFERTARDPEVEQEVRMSHDRLPNIKVILGVDRLDYSKGLPERIVAYQDALRRYPELQGNVTFIQVVVPSREDVPEYQAQRDAIERLVSQVNGEFTQPGWVPIHYLYRSLSRTELFAYYRLAEICLITPLKDGMNLVSKEYCACNIDGDGVLILSEFAGSAAQMHRSALMINPHDVEGTGEAIHRAVTMPRDERRARMRRLRANVRREDIFWWTDSFLRAGTSKRLEDFPTVEYFVPRASAEDMAISEAEG